MRFFILMVIGFSLLSCAQRASVPGGFYDKILHEKKTFKEYLKHRGNIEAQRLLEKDLYNTDKIVIISTFDGFISNQLVYDYNNDRYLSYKRKHERNNEKIFDYARISKEEVIPTYLFVLNYILDDKANELSKISEEALDTHPTSGSFIRVRILDTKSKIYKEYLFKEFMVYNGKPVMTQKEYYEALGISKD